MEDQKKCRRHGCGKKYLEQENNDTACKFHPGKPIFHDLKKGWTCCNKIVHDWDDFEKIEKCAVGMHNDVDPNQGNVGQDQFFKSDTVSNAQRGIDKSEQKIQVKKISEFNKQEQQKKEEQTSSNAPKEMKPVLSKEGLYKCTHKGCQKAYKPDENNSESCKFHPGEPVFHDLKKYWTCCKKETYDWDDFMKLPTCATGEHTPKMETA